MKTEKIWDEDSKGFIRIFATENVEKVNPIEYYKDYFLKKGSIFFKDILSCDFPILESILGEDFFNKKSKEEQESLFEKIAKTEIPKNFLLLLESSKKKEQEKILKNQSINPEQLMALIFTSYEKYGFLYSKYLFKNLSKGNSDKKLPKLVYIKDDGSIKKVGETNLKGGELKNIINHRKAIHSHFFEKEAFWHCLFLTYNSIAGKENWNNGQAHFHYISSSFGISKDDFLKSIQSGDYLSTSIHIELKEYGHQSIK